MHKMAAVKDRLSHSSPKSFNNFTHFRSTLLERLNWNDHMWSVIGESNNSFHKLVKSAKYWFGVMKQVTIKTSLVLTLFNENAQPLPSPLDLVRVMKENCLLNSFQGYSIGRNKNFYVFDFTTVKARNDAVKVLEIVNNAYVVLADWFVSPDILDFDITWLPRWISLKDVQEMLASTLYIIELERITVLLDNEDIVETGKMQGKARIKDLMKVSDVPYVFNIQGYDGLITIRAIRGRVPLCFNCNIIGHIARNCSLYFCKKCRFKHDILYQCFGASTFEESIISTELDNNIKAQLNTVKVDQNNSDSIIMEEQALDVIKNINDNLEINSINSSKTNNIVEEEHVHVLNLPLSINASNTSIVDLENLGNHGLEANTVLTSNIIEKDISTNFLVDKEKALPLVEGSMEVDGSNSASCNVLFEQIGLFHDSVKRNVDISLNTTKSIKCKAKDITKKDLQMSIKPISVKAQKSFTRIKDSKDDYYMGLNFKIKKNSKSTLQQFNDHKSEERLLLEKEINDTLNEIDSIETESERFEHSIVHQFDDFAYLNAENKTKVKIKKKKKSGIAKHKY